MKNLILSLLLIGTYSSYGQVIADPALSQMKFTAGLQDTTLSATSLPIDNVIRLKIPVYNRNLQNSLPSGTCKIKIGLGSKLIVDPNFNLATVNTSNYFHWTSEFYGGQVQITGELIAVLPANFSDTATFNVKGTILGNSTITNNFLITNHNTTVILSDEDPTNNNSFVNYTINVGGGPIPVTFTKIAVTKEACNIKVNFDAEREINVSRYDIEISKDGTRYEKIGQLAANNLLHYQYGFAITEMMKAATLYVRIKSVDKDDRFQYSETKRVSGNCSNVPGAVIYPNPVPHNSSQVVLNSIDVLFNGQYNIALYDMSGKLLQAKDIILINSNQYNYSTGAIASGQYIIRLLKNDGSQAILLKFQKL